MNDENIEAMNGGATEGASSDGDLDFQGQADQTGQEKESNSACGCGCKQSEKTESEDPANTFPKSQEPSGDGSGIKAGGAQNE